MLKSKLLYFTRKKRLETVSNYRIKTGHIRELQLMASHTFFKALCILERYLEKIARIKSSLPSGSYKTSLDTSHPPILLLLWSKQINRFKNEVDEQLSSLLDCWPAIF